MRDFFGTPWSDLTLQDVEVFLADAGDEGLTWEAKGGGQQPHTGSVLKGVCGFANGVGGFFIIGADRASGSWTLPGVAFRDSEPGTRLSSLIRDGLDPVPPFDVKVFDCADGRRAAIVGVEELDVPPCVTTSGVVYQRVSGQTLPVTDQRVLAELIARGRAARDTAEALALRAATRAVQEPADLGPDMARLSVALCPLQGAQDKAAALFSQPFAESLIDLAKLNLQVEGRLRYPVQCDVLQDCVSVWPASREIGATWKLAAYWDGSVSAVYCEHGDEFYPHELIARVRQGWRVLVDAATNLGGYGAAHLVVHVNPEHGALRSRTRPAMPTRRWTALRAPTDDEFGAVERELRRGFGERAWEPTTVV